MTATADVDVPKVGPVDKRVVTAVMVSAAGFVGYQYWHRKRMGGTASDTGAADAPTSEFDNTNSDPSAVLGAVSPTNSYGSGSSVSPADPASPSDFGFHGTSNDTWTQYAAAQLSQSDRWSYADIVEALGAYLAQRPTTASQQTIVSAAIAVAGHPPVGSFVLINAPTPIEPVTPTPTPTPTVEMPSPPTGVTVTSNTTSSFAIGWSPVTGAASYVVDTHNGHTHTTTGTTFTFTQFQHKTTYKITVRAVNSAGVMSGDSAAVTLKSK
jgi:hypothetical protein